MEKHTRGDWRGAGRLCQLSEAAYRGVRSDDISVFLSLTFRKKEKNSMRNAPLFPQKAGHLGGKECFLHPHSKGGMGACPHVNPSP